MKWRPSYYYVVIPIAQDPEPFHTASSSPKEYRRQRCIECKDV